MPGSIVRVAVENFVTYDRTEFRPGPHLNMIIGPNGTGKSTIVCAIALGLGWKPAVLGRAKDVASFVKQGHAKGWIEIELKGLPGDRNIVIRRSIERKSNSSEWTINSKKASTKDVTEAVSQFDVSVDNLCCFLPQDKVAEFARMDPPRLLVETELAAGESNLNTWHAALTELGAEFREIKEKLETEQDEQNNLEQRNEVLNRDVERYEQRQRLEEEIALLNLMVPFAEYAKARTDYMAKKALKNRRREELNELKKANRPIEKKVEELKERNTRIVQQADRQREGLRKTQRELKRYADQIDKLESDTQDLHSSFENVKERELQRQRLIADLRKKVADLERQAEQEPERVDTSAIDQALRDHRQEVRANEDRQREIRLAQDDISDENGNLQRRHDDTLRQLQQLDDSKSKKLQHLRQSDIASVQAIQWLRGNQSRFQQKVYEPVMVELSVKDDRYSKYVESCINWAQMRTFVCQTRADYDTMTAELIDKQGLRINVVENQSGKTVQQFEATRPLKLEQIRQMGFDDFVSNFIEGPEPVIEYLYTACNLHLIPVALKDTVNAEQVENSRTVRRYIANGYNHTVQFSEYGRRLPQTLSREIRANARTLSQSIDRAEKDRLEQVMKDINAKRREVEQAIGALQDEIDELKTAHQGFRERKDDLEGQRQDALQIIRDWERVKIERDGKRQRLETELRKPSSEVERKRIETQIWQKTKERLEVVESMHSLAKSSMKLRAKVDILTLEELQHRGNLTAWSNYLHAKDSSYKEAETLLRTATEEWTAAKQHATAMQNRAFSKFDSTREELRLRFQEEQEELTRRGEEFDAAELQSALTEKEAELEMAAGVAPGVVEAFKKRAGQIRALQESIAILTQQVARKADKIKQVRKRWEPALDDLVGRVSERFSAAFERIGCAGEVKLHKHEDDHYEKWGIDILVKFRDTERLQLLTGQRQSGGERSLSTILYLMSLTELSRAPFSLVDEINQGMDQRAERAVHDQMVEVTCRPDASQYFLITPKLLPDLRYHERMKVLIINNGEWLPDKLDLNSFVEAALTARKGKRRGGNSGGNGGNGTATPSSSSRLTAIAV